MIRPAILTAAFVCLAGVASAQATAAEKTRLEQRLLRLAAPLTSKRCGRT